MAERFSGGEGSGAGALGLLYAAPAFGAFVVTVTSGWVGRVRRYGLAILWAAGVWGVGIVAIGLAPTLPLALLALAVAGGGDMVSGIFRVSLWNASIPDAIRGRLASVEMISYNAGPLLGNAESGLAAAAIGVRGSIVSGGVLCVVGVAATAVLLPELSRWDRTGLPEVDAGVVPEHQPGGPGAGLRAHDLHLGPEEAVDEPGDADDAAAVQHDRVVDL
jgi:MFS family permease